MQHASMLVMMIPVESAPDAVRDGVNVQLRDLNASSIVRASHTLQRYHGSRVCSMHACNQVGSHGGAGGIRAGRSSSWLARIAASSYAYLSSIPATHELKHPVVSSFRMMFMLHTARLVDMMRTSDAHTAAVPRQPHAQHACLQSGG